MKAFDYELYTKCGCESAKRLTEEYSRNDRKCFRNGGSGVTQAGLTLLIFLNSCSGLFCVLNVLWNMALHWLWARL